MWCYLDRALSKPLVLVLVFSDFDATSPTVRAWTDEGDLRADFPHRRPEAWDFRPAEAHQDLHEGE